MPELEAERPRPTPDGDAQDGPVPGASEDALLAAWLVPDPDEPGAAAWRVTESGPEVWALAGYLEAAADAGPAAAAGRAALLAQAARDFELPREAVEAALAFYRRHRAAIDAVASANRPPAEGALAGAPGAPGGPGPARA